MQSEIKMKMRTIKNDTIRKLFSLFSQRCGHVIRQCNNTDGICRRTTRFVMSVRRLVLGAVGLGQRIPHYPHFHRQVRS
jgi:hypothetical protein